MTGGPAANHAFCTGVLGRRLVRKTVNQDGVSSADHLVYADGPALPGTDLTSFDRPVPREQSGCSAGAIPARMRRRRGWRDAGQRTAHTRRRRLEPLSGEAGRGDGPGAKVPGAKPVADVPHAFIFNCPMVDRRFARARLPHWLAVIAAPRLSTPQTFKRCLR